MGSYDSSPIAEVAAKPVRGGAFRPIFEELSLEKWDSFRVADNPCSDSIQHCEIAVGIPIA